MSHPNAHLGRPKVKVSDEIVKDIIRLHKQGYSCANLGRMYEVTPRTVHQWVNGDNRGHLLLEVERELEKK